MTQKNALFPVMTQGETPRCFAGFGRDIRTLTSGLYSAMLGI